jgi:uncharacterized protein YecE (DUF72 family)
VGTASWTDRTLLESGWYPPEADTPDRRLWTSKDIHERFGYDYSDAELGEWAPKVRSLAEDAQTTHVLFNNCYRDNAQRNARHFADLLET